MIEDIEDYSESINILCHGDTGSGKTRLWSRLPRLLIIATEPGAISARKAGVKCKVIKAGSWPKIVEAFEWLRDNPGEFDWILFDSITKAQALCIRHIMEMVVKANPSRDPLIPSQGDHFKWQLSMKQLVMDFNELPENVVWLARSMNKENPDGDDIIVPLIEGKDYGISAWVSGEMGLLCYLKKETKGKGASAQTVRKLYTNEHTMYWCKDWYDVLPHVVEFKSDVGVAEKLVKMLVDSGKSPQKEGTAKKAASPAKKKKAPSNRTRKA
jgi:hypothetical protein